MSQYKTGTVTVVLGNNQVMGTGTAWLSTIAPGDMLVVGDDGPAAFVAAVDSDTQLHLENGWPGASATGATYAIVRDFDPTSGAPLMSRGDVNVVAVFNRAIAALSVQTAVAVEGSEAVQEAREARDDAQAAQAAAAGSAAAAATDRAAVAGDKATVAADRATVAADKGTVITARDATLAAKTATDTNAAATAADRTTVAADKATVAADKATVITARDATLAAKAATDTNAAATAADRTAVAADKATVAADKATVAADKGTVAADKATVQTALASTVAARDAAAGSAGAAAADRVQTGADKASVATAKTQVEALVGSAGTGTATGLAFAALTKSLATAGDVVATLNYDTRLDSDGGAWTERPLGSWYWEALNTATRGANRRFPKVALLVLRVGSLTIYDGHDLDASGVPRMWMQFNNADGLAIASGTIPARHCFACNGRIFVAVSAGLYEINFTADTITRTGAGGTFSRPARNIAGRNATTGGAEQAISSGRNIVSSDCNAVHARVIPGGPLDSAGLPIPTVAVATAGGVSVIHPNGAVYDITDAGGVGRVRWLSDARLMFDKLSTSAIYIGPVPYADVASGPWRQATYAADPGFSPNLRAIGNVVASAIAPGAVGRSLGLEIYAEDPGNPANGMAAYVTKDYATGWQPGDIRGAWLCDTTTGNITGSAELVTNGDFSSGTTGWTATNSTISVVSGELEVISTGASGPGAYQDIPTVIGQTYLVRCVARRGTSTISVVLAAASAGQPNVFAEHSGTANAPLMLQFTATASSSRILIYAGGTPAAGQTLYFDAVSCRLALPDRSYKGKGLAVNGTLSRTALPCGLGSIGGFSVADYLWQPYNPEMDYGTGDWSIEYWMRYATGGGRFWQRAAVSGSGASITCYPASGLLCCLISDGTNSALLTSLSAVNTDSWRRVTICRRGASFELWVDGIREAVVAVGSVASLSNAGAILRVGGDVAGTSVVTNWSVLQFRTGAYAPTPAQINKMYRDEGALIVGGTAATLGGNSNSVTALAANDGNGTLAVGTGDGVSIFAGLGRVQYLDGASGGAAIGNDAITSVSASGPHLLIGTSAGAGIISDSVIARDRMLPAGPPVPRAASDPNVLRAVARTASSGPLDIAPRILVGEREKLSIRVVVDCKAVGAAATQRGLYVRQASLYRDAGGVLTLDGSVDVIGTDKEVTAGDDVTIVVDAASNSPAIRVTAADNTPRIWATKTEILNRISEENRYAA
jgi:hypothetical protein